MTGKIIHCPMCRSTDIYWDARGPQSTLHHCRKCGYNGAFILECDEESEVHMG
ncbi:MAG: hypothetical protein QCH35_00225 [Methanomicrobiaceae archaeon]|nr:hypothetical protein [Methanomicrobiaceae archaeon]